MVFCENCRENVLPKTYFSWIGFILGLGIPYLIYFMTKIPQCPNCNFPMPRRNMVFAIPLSQNLIKLSRISALQLTRLKDNRSIHLPEVSSKSQIRSNSAFPKYEHAQTASFNMMVNEVHNTISSESWGSKR